MRKKTFLFSVGLLIGFLLLVSLFDSNLALAQAAICSDRGEFCGFDPFMHQQFNCCDVYCSSHSCTCQDNTCCYLGGTFNRGEDCHCENECIGALTCMMSTDGHKECCDTRGATKRNLGAECHCNVECKSGECVEEKCVETGDTCGPAGCQCVNTRNTCEIILEWEVDGVLKCPTAALGVCCCPVCGNNIVDPGEDCDDGNNTNGDGCSADCKIEVAPPPVPGDTCTPAGCFCVQLEHICEFGLMGELDGGLNCPYVGATLCCCLPCGNNIVDPGEDCDDGNNVDGDGCSADCKIEVAPPPPAVCSNRGEECESSKCCSDLICKNVPLGPYPGFDKVCCDPKQNALNGEFCWCRDECVNHNCIRYVCGGLRPVAVCGDGNKHVSEECERDEHCDPGLVCSNCSCVSGATIAPVTGVTYEVGGDGGDGIISLKSPLGCTTIEDCISRIITFLFSLTVLLAPLMIIIAGFLYITAAGSVEKITQAKKLITWTLIGLLIASLANAIVYLIKSVTGG